MEVEMLEGQGDGLTDVGGPGRGDNGSRYC